MMQKKSIWAVLFVMLMMALSVNGAVAEDDALRSGDYQYRVLEDGTAEITSYSGGDSVLKIPNTLDGKTVTSIGDQAFSGCSSLTSVELSDSMISMGVNPFAGCESLKNIRVSPEQPVFAVIDGVLFNKAERSLICYPAGKQEEAYEVPQGIQQIKFDAFAGCRFLTTIELPDSVTSIGDFAFAGCSSLTSIELSDSVTSIGDGAFSWCSSLTNIELPDSVTSIGDGAFSPCSSLTNIELPDSVTSIGDRAFAWCSSLTNIELPDSVTSIGDQAFWGCDNLTMTVQRDSYAARYAKDNNLNYTYPDANDWLNN